MSKRYIALLRGINVGKAKRVAMGDLRTLVAGLGYSEVATLLNSGNVVFSGAAGKTAAAASAIEQALVRKLGVAARVMVLSSEELDEVMRENPLVDVATEHSRLLVFFLADPAARASLSALEQLDWTPEALALGSRAAYVWCPAGMIESSAVAALGKLLGDSTTSRNWNTISKLKALCVAK